jgi:hypothetical protein
MLGGSKMQTFMPYVDFTLVAKCLDNKRLGKQRVECWQIYLVLQKIKRREYLEDLNNLEIPKITPIQYEELLSLKHLGWEYHPIVKMWKGYEESLLYYGVDMCDEWISRGFKDTLKERFEAELHKMRPIPISTKLFKYSIEIDCPDWIDDKELQLSHQSNLVRKDAIHYRKYFPDVPNNLEYKWVK